MRIVSFNVQNLRLRHRAEGPHLDGARDSDVPGDAGAAAEALDPVDRRLTAEILRAADADLVALQEVFDRETLDFFHDRYLVPSGATPYPHRVCLPGNDGRGLDVAVMSRRPLDAVQSHAALRPADLGLAPPPGTAPDLPLFRRDCLRVRAGRLDLYVCHFKAPTPDAAAAWAVRRMEAEAVRRLIARRFEDPAEAFWLIAGDLNEPEAPLPGHGPATAPLTRDFGVDLIDRLPDAERWSFRGPETGHYGRPDALLAAPALARAWPDAMPRILRQGLGREVTRHDGPRLEGVGDHRPHASDHAAVLVEFPGL